VSSLKALQGFLDELISVILVVPYGIVADSYGRKIVVFLSAIGLILQEAWAILSLQFFWIFPTKAVYFASVFRVIGGGNAVLLAMLLTMLSDVSPSELR
jgi:MFS family permease